MDPVRHLRISVASLVSIIALGTIGYSLIEGWQAFDALYMTVITLTTVGFKEVQPLAAGGKLFTTVQIISGTSIIVYTLNNHLEIIAGGSLL